MLETITIFDDDEVADKTQSHRVTDIKEAVRDHNRVNVYIDDKYYCSLDISQVVDLGIKIGRKLNSEQLEDIKRASKSSFEMNLSSALRKMKSVLKQG